MSKNVKIRLGIAAAIVVLTLSLLIWGVCALVRPVMSLLGFDLVDYEGEEVTTLLACDSPEAKKVEDVLSMLFYSPSPKVHEFDGADEVASLYTDSILSYMMSRNYSKYVCNIELLSRASDSYANYNFRTVIPASDFRSEVYRAFGGERAVSEKSGEAFTYHEKIDSFSLVGSPYANTARVLIYSFGESEHAYKMTFAVESEGNISDKYTATCIQRDDATIYVKSIKKLAE